MARIIKTLIDEGPLNRTRLATYAELSYDKMMTYLSWLIDQKFVEENGGSIHVLEDGVKTYDRLVEWILKYVGRLKFSRKRF